MYERPTEKHFSFSAVNENADENKIPFTAENETKTKMDIHFRSKNENESHMIILVFLSFPYIQSPSQPCNAPSILRAVRVFLQVVLVDGIPQFHFPHVQCIDIFVAFF